MIALNSEDNEGSLCGSDRKSAARRDNGARFRPGAKFCDVFGKTDTITQIVAECEEKFYFLDYMHTYADSTPLALRLAIVNLYKGARVHRR